MLFLNSWVWRNIRRISNLYILVRFSNRFLYNLFRFFAFGTTEYTSTRLFEMTLSFILDTKPVNVAVFSGTNKHSSTILSTWDADYYKIGVRVKLSFLFSLSQRSPPWYLRNALTPNSTIFPEAWRWFMEGVLPSHRFSWDTFPLPLIENKRKAWYLGKAGSERALKNFHRIPSPQLRRL